MVHIANNVERAVGITLSVIAVAALLASGLIPAADNEKALLDTRIGELQDCLRANASQIENLTAQIAALNDKVNSLESALEEKTSRNGELERQTIELSDFLIDVESELRLLEKNEQAYMIVDRLRFPVNMSEEQP